MLAQCKQQNLYKAAVGVALVAGGLAAPSFAYAGTHSDERRGDRELPTKKLEATVQAAEEQVLKATDDAKARAGLGQAYLAAGRFNSASASFEDALALGDKTASTALGLALSYIATSRNVEANALLEQWRNDIPSSDFGLALAISGQPAQAIKVLGDAISQGENTPVIRQNLAYAYALAGHLREARTIAAQDIPADKLDVRVSEWALAASLGSHQVRVASLIGAPVRSDPGRSAKFALASPAAAPALAMVEHQPENFASPAELPANAPGDVAAIQLASFEPSAVEVVPAAAQTARQSNPEVADIADAMRRYKEAKGTQAPAQQSGEARTTANPSIAQKAAAPTAVAAVRARQATRQGAATAAPQRPAAGRQHLVQLGSFTTEAGARRAWGIFVSRDPSLKHRELRITEAMVNGRRYFRVAAAGYAAAEARTKCSTLKGRGIDCLALAQIPTNRGPVPFKALALASARS